MEIYGSSMKLKQILRRHGYNKTISDKWEEFKHSCIIKPLVGLGILVLKWLLRKQEIKQYELWYDMTCIKKTCNNNWYWIAGFESFFKFLEQDNAYRVYWTRFKNCRK